MDVTGLGAIHQMVGCFLSRKLGGTCLLTNLKVRMTILRYAPLLLLVALAACGNAETPAPTSAPTVEITEAPTVEASAPTAVASEAGGDPVAGQAIFQTQYVLPDGSMWACISCHSVSDNEMVLIGSPLYNIGSRAETRVEGESVVEYLHNAIVNPDAFIVPVPTGSPLQQWSLPMPSGFGEVLSEQDLDNLIAYLLTLHD